MAIAGLAGVSSVALVVRTRCTRSAAWLVVCLAAGATGWVIVWTDGLSHHRGLSQCVFVVGALLVWAIDRLLRAAPPRTIPPR
ncbi:MAG: hypothetical protein GX446_13095 [Chthonomonadales bacterium]|nr:hypothetical protein [Chthonomonadales bacterium]